jgi:hypothetical protein
MWLVLAWNTGFEYRYMAPMLSHHSQAAGGHTSPISFISVWIRITSVVALAIALYSTYVLDLETVACLRAFQEIRLEPRYTAKPPVDLLSSRESAQSESKNALINIDLELLITSPIFVSNLRYLNIRFTAAQCTVIGA